MIDVPKEFMPTINTVYPFENYTIFEEWVSKRFIPDFNGRDYLRINWTSYHVNNNYGNDPIARRKLQGYVDSLPRDKTYWTICQYDDGVLVDFKDLDVLVFNMSKKEGIEIPLLCMPHSYQWDGIKNIYASFIGTNTHPIRENVFNIQNPDYYISKEQHDVNRFCDVISHSIFGLCPRGYGLNSFRIAECLQYETIPVYISDEFVNCFNANFEDYGVIIEAKDAHRIVPILNSVSDIEIVEKQLKIKEIYNKYYTYQGALLNILNKLDEDSSNS
jgi:hypothetical protein